MTPETRELIIEALRAQAATRQRAATRAAGELYAEPATADKRPASVRIAKMLAEASVLVEAADELADGAELTDPAPRPSAAPTPAAEETRPSPAAVPGPVTLPVGTTAEDIVEAVTEAHDAGLLAIDETVDDLDLADVDAVLPELADAAV